MHASRHQEHCRRTHVDPCHTWQKAELHSTESGQWCCSIIRAQYLITAQRCPVWPALLPACASSQIITRQDTTAYATVPLRTAGLIEESCPHEQQHLSRCEELHHHRRKAQEQSSHLPASAVLRKRPQCKRGCRGEKRRCGHWQK